MCYLMALRWPRPAWAADQTATGITKASQLVKVESEVLPGVGDGGAVEGEGVRYAEEDTFHLVTSALYLAMSQPVNEPIKICRQMSLFIHVTGIQQWPQILGSFHRARSA